MSEELHLLPGISHADGRGHDGGEDGEDSHTDHTGDEDLLLLRIVARHYRDGGGGGREGGREGRLRKEKS